MSVRLRLPNPLAALDDRALLARFAEQHEQSAFEQLVKRHGGLVFGVCRRAVGDLHLAEDAFQAVFLVLARNPTRAAEAASVGGWLFGVARRVGLAARRHEKRREKREQQANPVREGGFSQSDFDELLRVLDEELTALPEELRAPLVACFLEEQTQDEAARELGWSLSTLRRRLERGKELLRSRLARRGMTLSVGLLAGALSSSARGSAPLLASTPSPISATLAAEVFKRGLGAKLAATVAVVVVAGGVALGLGQTTSEEPPAVPLTPARAEPEPQPDPVSKPDPTPQRAPAPREVAPKQWVNVSGRVVFPKDRDIPKLRQVPANAIKDADLWKPFTPLHYEEILIHADTHGLKNVVVWLRPDSDDRKAEFPADTIHPEFADAKPNEHAVLVDRGQFEPRVLAVRAGDSIAFPNSLPVMLNVHYTVPNAEDATRNFNVLIESGKTYVSKPVPARGLPELFKSNIYQWMTGYVWAFEHPYFAVTDEKGNFAIPNAPAGNWRLVAWHEKVGYLGGPPGRLGEKITLPDAKGVELKPLVFENKNWPKE
ncbi:MAG: sigma-70 family RNA polymerase sigma factor [Planctomycetia bacterium]|nr:sigma-70 family RNA polymerase sigma factor [Planctomycetia bacterium]